jgi:tetratricopeptide (TPR) repeat protein
LAIGGGLAGSWSNLASYRLWIGDPEGALDAGRRALALASDLGDSDLQAINTAHLARAHNALGDYQQARTLFTDAVDRLRGDVSFEGFGQATLPAVFSCARLAWCLAQLGRFSDGIAYGEEAVQIARTADQPFSLVVAWLGLGSLHLLKGDLPRAVPALERALNLCQTWTISHWFPTAASSLGYAYVLSSRVKDGVALLHEATEQAIRTGIDYDEAPTLAWLSEAELLDGRPDQAMSLAQRALDRSRRHGHRGHEAYGLRVLAEIAAALDVSHVETAKDHYHQTLALATELEMRPLVAHCHHGLGKLYRRANESEQAQKHLATATAMYREMGMQFWLETAEEQLRKLS